MAAPISDSIILAVSRLVDDAGATREPSHSEIEFQIQRAKLQSGDPSKTGGSPVGKVKRVRGTLSWALEHNPDGGSTLIDGLIALLRACGAFRPSSQNFVGAEAIANAISSFGTEGYELTGDGELRAILLDNLAGTALNDALRSYIRRARRGADDAVLVTGTGKDLLEATAAHVIVERFGSYPQNTNFPTLLGQAFIALDFATPENSVQMGEPPQRRLERAMYEVACSVNAMRNKLGTGHGRPWLTTVSDDEAKTAIEFMGTIAEAMLARLWKVKRAP